MKNPQRFTYVLLILAIFGCEKEQVAPQRSTKAASTISASLGDATLDTVHHAPVIVGCHESHHTLVNATGNPTPIGQVPVGEVTVRANASSIQVDVRMNVQWFMTSIQVSSAVDEAQICNAPPHVIQFQPTHTYASIVVPRYSGAYNALKVEIVAQKIGLMGNLVWTGAMLAWNQFTPQNCAPKWIRLDFGCCEYATIDTDHSGQ